METIYDRIAAKKAQLGQFGPLSCRSLSALTSWYDVELTYTSNAIEGNALARNETAILLNEGVTVNGKLFTDHAEAIGHKEALSFIRSIAISPHENGPIVRECDIRELHRLFSAHADPEEAGQYRRHTYASTGSGERLPSPEEISPLMETFCRFLESAQPTPQTAFDAHLRLSSIFPFKHGNGQTARLLTNLVLFKGGYPPVIISPKQHSEYTESLETYSFLEDPLPFRRFMADRLESSLDRYILSLEIEEAHNTGRATEINAPLRFTRA